MTPDPRLCSLYSFGMLGCGTWSPKNLLKNGSSNRSRGISSRDLIILVVEIFTTEGVATAATSDCASESCDRISTDFDDIWLLAGSWFDISRCEDRTRPTNTPSTRMNKRD